MKFLSASTSFISTIFTAMHKLTDDKVNGILSLLGQSKSTRTVAEQLDISLFTVQRIRKERLQDAELSSSGRPEKLSPQNKRYCIRAVTSGQLDTATAATK